MRQNQGRIEGSDNSSHVRKFDLGRFPPRQNNNVTCDWNGGWDSGHSSATSLEIAPVKALSSNWLTHVAITWEKKKRSQGSVTVKAQAKMAEQHSD